MLARYALVLCLVAFAVALGRVALLQTENANLMLDVAALKGHLALCKTRTRNIIEDRKSDATVIDPRDYNVPERWLLPDDNAARD